MSYDVIYGNDCLAEILVSSNWYPILCQSEMRFKVQQEVILATGPNSGFSREKKSRISESFATITGLTPINNGTNISVFYLIQESIRTVPQTIRLTYADQSGNDKQISGTAIIANIDLGTPIGDFAEATIDFEFSGAISISSVALPPGIETVQADYWTPTAGQAFISGLSAVNGYSLVGKTILEVDREGTQYDFIGNNLTPGNRQCSWDTTFNHLVFKDAFNTGETVWVIFKQ